MNKNLVFDIGMHTGQDTRYYLDQGFDVVAVEANPILVQENESRFKKYIQSGRLVILNVGINGQKEGMATFYRNTHLSQWSSFDPVWGCRKGKFEEIQVPMISSERLFKEFGVPYFLKIDIEGYDHFCLSGIPDVGEKPQYVSCEASDLDWLEILYQKGYRKFKMIEQHTYDPINIDREKKWYIARYQIVKYGIKLRLQKVFPFRNPYDSSGPLPFGPDERGPWLCFQETQALYRAFYRNDNPLNHVSWFDFHASL